ncbi:hypothetical protein D3C76_1128120 [compost metagenome]
MIGQIELIKITQIDAGPAALNTSRPIGNQANGETGRSKLMIGANMSPRKAKRPSANPSGIPSRAARPKPIPTRPREASTFQPMPISFGPLS